MMTAKLQETGNIGFCIQRFQFGTAKQFAG
jgi:hypothetical protein